MTNASPPSVAAYFFITVVATSLCFAADMPVVDSAAVGAPPAPAANAKAPREPDAILAQLNSGDPAEVTTAAARLRKLAERKPSNVNVRNFGEHFKKLSDLKRYDDLDAVLLVGIKGQVGYLSGLSQLLKLRIDGLISASRYPEALQQAKAFYNVAAMRDTPEATAFIDRALRGEHPNDPSFADRFRDEQVAGARAGGAGAPGGGESVLAGVRAPAQYADEIKRRSSAARQDFDSLTAIGNPFLLGDQPDEAIASFKKAYEMAGDDPQLREATESLARALRAADGSVGRANAFVLAVRRAPTTGPG